MPRKNTTKRAGGITPEYFKKNLGNRVYEVRTSLKMTQVEFGETINIANYQISRYEHGKDEVSIFVAMKICDTFDIAIEDFLLNIYKEEEVTHASTQQRQD